MKKPEMILPKDEAYLKLKKAVQIYLNKLEKKDPYDEENEDDINDIFEKAVELFYGRDVWKWINTRLL